MSRLEDVGAVEVLPGGEVSRRGLDGHSVARAARAQAGRESFDRSRVEMIRDYAELGVGCRRAFVLSYFGEPFEPPCGRCDLCDAGLGEPGDVEEPFPVGSRVTHAEWGGGVVQRYAPNELDVLFDEVGYKTLALDVVQERVLLSGG